MNNEIILFFLCICIAVLICIVVYQQFSFSKRNTEAIKRNQSKAGKNTRYGQR